MKGQTYLKNVVTLELDVNKCTGCGLCATVCPHGVFEIGKDRAVIVDRDACMECGACSRNCPVEAISVRSGVGCAAGILSGIVGAGRADSECCCQPDDTCP